MTRPQQIPAAPTRCRCTHRRIEHPRLGPCTRPGCGCLAMRPTTATVAAERYDVDQIIAERPGLEREEAAQAERRRALLEATRRQVTR